MFAEADLFIVNDTLDSLLLGSFFFGLVFVVISLGMGLAEIGFGHDHGGIDANHDAGGTLHGLLSQLNAGSILAFLTWFGGVTYLLRNAVGLNVVLSILIGIGAGVAAAALVLRLMKMLRAKEVYLDEREERMTGLMARVSSPVRSEGTGEITYILNGVRQVSAARTANGLALPRGAEVVVMRRERGIAYVEPWVEETAEDQWERQFLADTLPPLEALPQSER